MTILANAVYNPRDFSEVYHNGTDLIGLSNEDMLSASLSAAVTGSPRKTFKQLSGSDIVVPSHFFGQHATADSCGDWAGKLLKIGPLAMQWNNLTPKGSLAVTFAGQDVTWTAHGRGVGAKVAFFAPANATISTAGVLPTGISADTIYHVVATPDANTIRVSATEGGVPITFSGSPANCGVMFFDAAKLAGLDAVIDACAAQGKELIYQTHATPTWASSDGASDTNRPKGCKAFATYLRILHGRVTDAGNSYADVLTYLEGWNEPNTGGSFSGTQYSDGGRYSITFGVDAGLDWINWTAHGLPIGTPFQVETLGTGTLPTGLSAEVVYFVVASGYTADRFRFSTEWTEDGSGAYVALSDSGTTGSPASSNTWKIVTCDLTIHQAWIYKAAKSVVPSIGVISPSYTGAPGQIGSPGIDLVAYRGARANSARYELTECIYLTATDGKVHTYRCTTAGTTAAAQPTYAGAAAEAITDGTAVFTECSKNTSSLVSWFATNGGILGNFIDVLGTHFYKGAPAFFSFDWGSVDATVMAQAACSLTSKPIWCTEFGISGPVEPEELWRMYLYSIGSGVEAFVYFTWDAGSGLTSAQVASGLYGDDCSMQMTDSPLADTYNEIANTLTGATINYVNCNNWTGQVGASINGVARVF